VRKFAFAVAIRGKAVMTVAQHMSVSDPKTDIKRQDFGGDSQDRTGPSVL